MSGWACEDRGGVGLLGVGDQDEKLGKGIPVEGGVVSGDCMVSHDICCGDVICDELTVLVKGNRD